MGGFQAGVFGRISQTYVSIVLLFFFCRTPVGCGFFRSLPDKPGRLLEKTPSTFQPETDVGNGRLGFEVFLFVKSLDGLEFLGRIVVAVQVVLGVEHLMP